MTTTISRTSCPPRFGTPRNPDRPTLGGAVDAVARRMGKPFMPHQRLVADVILEIDPATGLLAYSEWGLMIPRQEGKSTLVEAKASHRCSATGFFGPRQHVVYTAQTRQKAREKWEEDFVADLEASREFGPSGRNRVSVHKGNGNEHVRFRNGSRFGLEASTEKAGHGTTIDEALIDEAFALKDFRLEQAFGPAMITRLNKQLAWISTAGWLGGSPYLEEKYRLGRRAARDGRRGGLAYFEWSAPEDADPGDPATWYLCMPALCPDPPCRCGRGKWRHTITPGAIRAEYEKARDSGKMNDFRRAYLNQWVSKDDLSGAWLVIDRGTWLALAERSMPRPVTPAFAIDMTPDRSATAIGLAGGLAGGRAGIEIPEGCHRPGTSWVVAEAKRLNERHAPCAWAVDGRAEARTLTDDLERAGLRVTRMTAGDVAQACGQFYDAVRDGRLAHCDDPGVRTALGGTTWRPQGKTRAFDEDCGLDLSPLMAVTLAHWGYLKFGSGADYDVGDSVGWGAGEVVRQLAAGVYGPADITRLRLSGLLDDDDLKVIGAAGFPVPAGI